MFPYRKSVAISAVLAAALVFSGCSSSGIDDDPDQNANTTESGQQADDQGASGSGNTETDSDNVVTAPGSADSSTSDNEQTTDSQPANDATTTDGDTSDTSAQTIPPEADADTADEGVTPSEDADDSSTVTDMPASGNDDDAEQGDSSNPADDSAAQEADAGEQQDGASTVVELPADNGSSEQPGVDGSIHATLGIDSSGGDDDSPTRTESLSLFGSSIKDASRGAGPPSAPTGITKLLAAENWVEFSWVPSVDDQAVKAYEIYRDGQWIATVTENFAYEHDYRSWLSTSFIDCNYTRYKKCEDENLQPQPGASYAYSVAAIDNEGMRSPRSEEVMLSMATPQQSTVDLSGYSQVFTEEFDNGFVDPARWRTSLAWGEKKGVNGEMQYYVNPQATVNPISYDPFKFTSDTLQLTGIKTPANDLEAAKLEGAAEGQPYLSGVLTTLDRFSMTYGYVEMRAKLPAGAGILPTYYLFNKDFERNKPEIDIIEYLGSRPTKINQTYHYYDSNRARFSSGEKHSSPTMETDANLNLSSDYHNYSVLWEPELVVWYIDGQEVRRLEGPRVSDEPMNIVIQLVMGSDWVGVPDAAALPAVLEIDYVRAWQKK